MKVVIVAESRFYFVDVEATKFVVVYLKDKWQDSRINDQAEISVGLN